MGYGRGRFGWRGGKVREKSIFTINQYWGETMVCTENTPPLFEITLKWWWESLAYSKRCFVHFFRNGEIFKGDDNFKNRVPTVDLQNNLLFTQKRVHT